jgi:transcriptional regulator with XRE-family HTH domain
MPRSIRDVAFDLGIRIRDRRLRRGWSQSRLAELTGTSSSTISRMELGQGAAISLATWVVVAAAVNDDPFATRDDGSAALLDAFSRLIARAAWVAAGDRDGFAVFDRPPRPGRRPIGHTQLPAERIVVRVLWSVTDIGVERDRLRATVSQISSEEPGLVTGGVLVATRTTAVAHRLGRTDAWRTSPRWLSALRDPDVPIPPSLGLVWLSPRGTHLLPWSRRVA